VSGFLQRLAAAAISPDRSIHPVVGSVFSPPGRPMGAAPILESSSTHVITPGPAATASAAVAGASTPQSPKSPPIESLAGAAAPAPRDREPIPAAGEAPAPRDAGELIHRPSQHRLTETPAVESRDPPAVRDPPLLLPRISEAAADARRPATERRAASPPAVGRSPARIAPRADARKESDEIEIHIGRIEVTAMPPPATPRAVKAPRKSLNLDEYLGRGGRGGR
jgi:hypothetical protein